MGDNLEADLAGPGRDVPHADDTRVLAVVGGGASYDHRMHVGVRETDRVPFIGDLRRAVLKGELGGFHPELIRAHLRVGRIARALVGRVGIVATRIAVHVQLRRAVAVCGVYARRACREMEVALARADEPGVAPEFVE